MTLAILFRPEAGLDLIETRDWYERQQLGLGEAFANSVDETLDRIEAMPQMYAVVFRVMRRVKLRRFPYLVYYRVSSELIEVIAVLHGSRDPKLWQERVN